MTLRWLRHGKRWGSYLGLGCLGLIAVLTIAAITPRQWQIPPSHDCRFTIYITSDGMHTNFFVPVRTAIYDWSQQLDLEAIGNDAATNYRYLQFGWGDRLFYMQTPSWQEVRLTNALRALFYWRNAAAIFVKGHATAPQVGHEQVTCLHLSATNYLALMQFLQATFQTDAQGQVDRLGSGQDQQSSFYAATGFYSILYTCNSWTAEGLRAANINTPLWGGLAPPIMWHLRNGCECHDRQVP
ncbi:TIGR02117 family protein [Pantanalinema rosaneae CENA516]|uniref:TIGR02117 family protein n=1 Tax=Pantanalinema rosaneae TaxID=1620701 RepID=UPI003D6F9EE4